MVTFQKLGLGNLRDKCRVGYGVVGSHFSSIRED